MTKKLRMDKHRMLVIVLTRMSKGLLQMYHDSLSPEGSIIEARLNFFVHTIDEFLL